jgi:hypothetical protein
MFRAHAFQRARYFFYKSFAAFRGGGLLFCAHRKVTKEALGLQCAGL